MDLYSLMSPEHYAASKNERQRASDRGRWRHELKQIEERERAGERSCCRNDRETTITIAEALTSSRPWTI